MALDIRVLSDTDYDNILVDWWAQWDWEAPSKDFLPDNGKGGFIVYDSDTPICAGFMYMTNSKVCWVDWIVSNKEYREKPYRKEAITLLIDTLTNVGKNMGCKYVYALIKHGNLIKTYEELGYVKGDSYTSEMIKIL